MSGSTTPPPYTIPGGANFPAVGPTGFTGVIGAPGGYPVQVLGDQGMWVSGPWLISLLAENRVQTQLIYNLLGTETTNLAQMRADAIADMGTLFSTTLAAPVPSS
jgi:hypothetical protein